MRRSMRGAALGCCFLLAVGLGLECLGQAKLNGPGWELTLVSSVTTESSLLSGDGRTVVSHTVEGGFDRLYACDVSPGGTNIPVLVLETKRTPSGVTYDQKLTLHSLSMDGQKALVSRIDAIGDAFGGGLFVVDVPSGNRTLIEPAITHPLISHSPRLVPEMGFAMSADGNWVFFLSSSQWEAVAEYRDGYWGWRFTSGFLPTLWRVPAGGTPVEQAAGTRLWLENTTSGSWSFAQMRSFTTDGSLMVALVGVEDSATQVITKRVRLCRGGSDWEERSLGFAPKGLMLSPDGGWLAIGGPPPAPAAASRTVPWLMRVDGTELRVLDSPLSDATASGAMYGLAAISENAARLLFNGDYSSSTSGIGVDSRGFWVDRAANRHVPVQPDLWVGSVGLGLSLSSEEILFRNGRRLGTASSNDLPQGIWVLRGRLPAPLIVNSLGDEPDADPADMAADADLTKFGMQGTLRSVIEEAHRREGSSRITILINTSAEHTISLRSPLPRIQRPMVLDAMGFPLRLDGLSLGISPGLQFAAPGCEIRNLKFTRFSGSAVIFEGGGTNLMEACVVGGFRYEQAGNQADGVLVRSNSHLVLKNVHISDNSGDGILIDGRGASAELSGTNNRIEWNGGSGLRSMSLRPLRIDGARFLNNSGWGLSVTGGVAVVRFLESSWNGMEFTASGDGGVQCLDGGFDAAGADFVEISYNGGDGIESHLDKEITLRNARVLGNAFNGIHVPRGSVTLLGPTNQVSFNARSGIYSLDGKGVAIESAEFIGNRLWGMHASGAVFVTNSAQFSFNGKTLDVMNQGGCLIEGGTLQAPGTVSLHAISNRGAGIRIKGGPTIVENIWVIGNKSDGIQTIGNSQLLIKGLSNVVCNNGLNGVNASMLGSIDIESLTVSSNRHWGLYSDGTISVLHSLRVDHNGFPKDTWRVVQSGGVFVENGSFIAPVPMEVVSNAGTGLRIFGSGVISLRDARILKNGGDGIYAPGTTILLKGLDNQINGNGGHGIACQASSSFSGELFIQGVDCSFNGGWGAICGGGVEITGLARFNRNGRAKLVEVRGGLLVGNDIFAGNAVLFESIGNRGDGVRTTTPPSFIQLTQPQILLNRGVGVYSCQDLEITGGRVCGNFSGDVISRNQKILFNVILDAGCDGDGDGATDDEENLAGDGNHDGEPDRAQAQVASIQVPGGEENLTFSSFTGSTLKVTVPKNAAAPAPPTDVQMGMGLAQLQMGQAPAGQSVVVEVHAPPIVQLAGYFKYGPTPENSQPHWYEFAFDGQTGAVFADGKVLLHFVDGARGDDDLAVNGRIASLGGFGWRGAPSVSLSRPGPDGVVRLQVQGLAGRRYRIERSADLWDWGGIVITNAPQDRFEIQDPQTGDSTTWFYRASEWP